MGLDVRITDPGAENVSPRRETRFPFAWGPATGRGRDQCHRERPDKTPNEQADQDAGQETAAHEAVTKRRTIVVFPFTRPLELWGADYSFSMFVEPVGNAAYCRSMATITHGLTRWVAIPHT